MCRGWKVKIECTLEQYLSDGPTLYEGSRKEGPRELRETNVCPQLFPFPPQNLISSNKGSWVLESYTVVR